MADASATMKFRDSRLPIEVRVEDLLSRMTLEEKIGQTVHNAPAIPRLGVPEYNWWNEGLHGVARAGRATVFPQAIGMAASFDVDLMRQVATAISDEARAKHHAAVRQGNRRQYLGLTYWSPNINIFRDPRWGRGQETYGEDPHLTARMGVAFVKGLQGDDPRHLKLVATPKHYAVHSGPEKDRHHFDAKASPRDLAETYLPAFEACVREAGAESIMGAYNRTNGEPCCASPTLLGEILRRRWGFEGFVVSDCGAICDFHQHHKITTNAAESAALAVKSGCDLNCGKTYPNLVAAVREGLITEAEIDVCVRRLLRARFKLGLFDPEAEQPYARIPETVVESEAHRSLARRMAAESLVLLKNEGDLLPLRRDYKCVGVVGPNAAALRPLLGNYYGYSANMVTPLEGILGAVSPGTDVLYDPGVGLRAADADAGIRRAVWVARQSDVVIAVMGLSPELEGEEGEVAESDGGGDRIRIGLPGKQEEMLKALQETGKPVVLVLTCGSPVEIAWAKRNLPAILLAWYPGEEGGNAIADALFGEVSPAGRLPFTVPRSLDQLPPFEDYAMAGRTYRYMTEEPLYRFGFGLSYTTFTYGAASLSRATVPASNPTVEIEVEVANAGARAGDEVVQLYVRDVQASVPVPRHRLEGFRRVHLKPGERRKITFALRPEQLAAHREDGTPFVEPGEFRLFVGGCQPDDPAFRGVEATLRVTG